MKVLSVGSVPQEWGGQAGGVAIVHRQFLLGLQKRVDATDISWLGLLATNATNSKCDLEFVESLNPPVEGRKQKEWFYNLLLTKQIDCVVFFHIAHKWAEWFSEFGLSLHAVGAIHSWSMLSKGRADAKRRQIEKVLPSMSSLIFPSKHCLDTGVELGFSYHCPVNVVHNPLQSEFSVNEVSLIEKKKRPQIVFVGALIELKRASFVVRAAAYLNVDLLIVGSGELQETLEALVVELDIVSLVSFSEHLTPVELSVVLAQSCVLCVPSVSESFGNVYIESLASGTPVVGFDRTLAEISGKVGFEVGVGVGSDANVEDVVEAIKYVIGKDWDRELLSSGVRAAFSSKVFSAEYFGCIA